MERSWPSRILAADVIYVMNPGSLGTAQTFPVPRILLDPNYASGRDDLSRRAGDQQRRRDLLRAFIVGGDGFDGFFKLDTNSGAITDYRIDSFGGDLYRVALTSDGSRAFFNNDGEVFSVDTATDTVIRPLTIRDAAMEITIWRCPLANDCGSNKLSL